MRPEWHIARCISAWILTFFAFTLAWVGLRVCGLSFVTTAVILTPALAVAAWNIPDAVTLRGTEGDTDEVGIL